MQGGAIKGVNGLNVLLLETEIDDADTLKGRIDEHELRYLIGLGVGRQAPAEDDQNAA